MRRKVIENNMASVRFIKYCVWLLLNIFLQFSKNKRILNQPIINWEIRFYEYMWLWISIPKYMKQFKAYILFSKKMNYTNREKSWLA